MELKHSVLVTIVLILLCTTSAIFCTNNDNEVGQVLPSMKRNPKFLSLFTRIQFPNVICNAGNSTQGVCYTREQCRQLNGKISSKTCARDFGVCCVFERTCGERIQQQVTYFSDPRTINPRAAIPNTCFFSLDVPPGRFCQLRLDFKTFSLTQPENQTNTGFTCKKDFFHVLGNFEQSVFSNDQRICGEMGGQHVYLHMDPDATQTSTILHINTDPSAGTDSEAEARKWRIKASFIECSAKAHRLAPRPCLQYFTKPNGTIESFNFNNGTGHYFGGMEYQICILRKFGKRSITYKASQIELDQQDLDSKDLCVTEGDWLAIPSKNDPLRFCDNNLGDLNSTDGLKVDLLGQYTLTFHSDNQAEEGEEVGFKIDYEQQE